MFYLISLFFLDVFIPSLPYLPQSAAKTIKYIFLHHLLFMCLTFHTSLVFIIWISLLHLITLRVPRKHTCLIWTATQLFLIIHQLKVFYPLYRLVFHIFIYLMVWLISRLFPAFSLLCVALQDRWVWLADLALWYVFRITSRHAQTQNQ